MPPKILINGVAGARHVRSRGAEFGASMTPKFSQKWLAEGSRRVCPSDGVSVGRELHNEQTTQSSVEESSTGRSKREEEKRRSKSARKEGPTACDRSQASFAVVLFDVRSALSAALVTCCRFKSMLSGTTRPPPHMPKEQATHSNRGSQLNSLWLDV